VSNRLYERAMRLAQGKKADFGEIFTLLEQAHASNDLRATYALGTWYFHGRHVARNLRKGVRYWREAADGNISDALFDLAVAYETGAGAPKSLRTAYGFYLRAALAGDLQAPYEVGRLVYYGIGVSKDRRAAKIWLDHAGRVEKQQAGLTQQKKAKKCAIK